MPVGPDVSERTGPYVGAIRADGGWFGPGDDLERAWDEAEAILLAVEDLDAVMDAIRDAESPVEARRTLKFEFGFTGRQAALLLTLPVMSFTRSERRRLDDARRARIDLLADVTGVLPVVADPAPGTASDTASDTAYAPEFGSTSVAASDPDGTGAPAPAPSAEPVSAPAEQWEADFGATFDGILAGISSAMENTQDAGTAHNTVAAEFPSTTDFPTDVESPAGAASQPQHSASRVRRSMSELDEASTVLDEQLGELCDALASLIGTRPAGVAWSDDPRSSSDPAGMLLDSCGVDDATGIRTLLWHLHRTGLDSVEGLFPFAEPLTAGQGFDAQSAQFEKAMAIGGLGSRPSSSVHWASRLWPIADRRGFGYAVVIGDDQDAGSVWAYGGDEPLHRMWDSVVDLLVEVYRSLTAGDPCDAAVGAVLDGRVAWTNLS